MTMMLIMQYHFMINDDHHNHHQWYYQSSITDYSFNRAGFVNSLINWLIDWLITNNDHDHDNIIWPHSVITIMITPSLIITINDDDADYAISFRDKWWSQYYQWWYYYCFSSFVGTDCYQSSSLITDYSLINRTMFVNSLIDQNMTTKTTKLHYHHSNNHHHYCNIIIVIIYR